MVLAWRLFLQILFGHNSDNIIRLLRLQPGGTAVVSVSQQLFVNTGSAAAYADLPLGKEVTELWRAKVKSPHRRSHPLQYVLHVSHVFCSFPASFHGLKAPCPPGLGQ